MTKTEKGEETMSRKLRKKILGDSLIWVVIAAFVVIMLFPFVYILSTALKSDTDLATSVGRILPKAVQWEMTEMIKKADDLLYSIKTTTKGTYRI